MCRYNHQTHVVMLYVAKFISFGTDEIQVPSLLAGSDFWYMKGTLQFFSGMKHYMYSVCIACQGRICSSPVCVTTKTGQLGHIPEVAVWQTHYSYMTRAGGA